MSEIPVWLDGRLCAPNREAEAAERALLARPGCYTTARIADGRPRWAAHHARRLRRDAQTLGIGDIAEATVLTALGELGEAAFGSGEGIVRLQASRGTSGRAQLLGTARLLGEEPPTWQAIVSSEPHPGPTARDGAKVSGVPLYSIAWSRAQAVGADECLLFDGDNFLVEGARSNLFFVDGSGALAVPDLARGAVAGIAQQIARQRLRDVTPGDLHRTRLGELRELIAVNAVRGACPIVRLDDKPVGTGEPGPWSRRLADLLSRE